MDPFTITTGIFTLLGACSTISKTIDTIRKNRTLPDILCSLSNEVTDLRLVLLDIHDRREDFFKRDLSCQEKRLLELCHCNLERTWTKVHDAEEVLRESMRRSGPGDKVELNLRRISQEHGKLTRLKAEIREARLNIQSLCSQLGLQQTAQIRVQLDSVVAHSIANQNRLLEDTTTILQSNERVETKLDQVLQMQCALSSASNGARASYPAEASFNSQTLDVSLSRIQYKQPRTGCSCRNRATNRSHGYIAGFLGNLFFGYAATPILSRHETSCRLRFRAKLNLIYSFPRWFLHVALALHAHYIAPSNIEWSLTTRPILPNHHFAMDLIELCDFKRLRELFAIGELSPKANTPQGSSLLHHVIARQNAQATEFLLKMGVDRQAVDAISRTANQTVWDRILCNLGSSEWRSRMMELFPDPDFEEMYEFSELHIAILGFGVHEPKQILEAKSSLVHSLDSSGKAPLAWAAQRNDTATVELLLSHGADPNQTDYIGKTPLIYTAQSGAPACLERLLQAGADATIRDRYEMTVVHWALAPSSQVAPPSQLIEPLLSAGCDVNWQDINGATAMHWAGSNPRATYDLLERLLSYGADLQRCDFQGYTPLSVATRYNQHTVVGFLLNVDANQEGPLVDCGTFAHIVAEYADTETLRLLVEHPISPRDINVKNQKGLTPVQAGLRRDTDIEWRSHFMEFLKAVDKDTAPRRQSCETVWIQRDRKVKTSSQAVDESHVSGDEQFEDAVESMVPCF